MLGSVRRPREQLGCRRPTCNREVGARRAQGGCREGDFGASLAHFGVGWGSLGALWGRSAYVKVTFVYFGLTLVTWWSHFGCKKVCF